MKANASARTITSAIDTSPSCSTHEQHPIRLSVGRTGQNRPERGDSDVDAQPVPLQSEGRDFRTKRLCEGRP